MFYPINLKIDDMKIAIIGGGKVAYRKCMNLLAFNKNVTVISKDFTEEFDKVKNYIDIIYDAYDEKYIKDAFVVIAATNNKNINKKIGIYCREHGKLINVIDNVELSNFIVPSYVKRGDLVLSVSTGGKSPSLSRKIKKELEESYDETYEEYVNLLGKARRKIIENSKDINERKKEIKDLLSLDLEHLKLLIHNNCVDEQDENKKIFTFNENTVK